MANEEQETPQGLGSHHWTLQDPAISSHTAISKTEEETYGPPMELFTGNRYKTAQRTVVMMRCSQLCRSTAIHE